MIDFIFITSKETPNFNIMTKSLHSIKNIILLVFIGLVFTTKSNGQNPFNCDYNAYLFQFNDIYAVDLASGSYYLVKEDIIPGRINGAAYNPADGFIWGAVRDSKDIVRIGADFEIDLFEIPELPDANKYVGAIDPNGLYFLKGSGADYHTMDLDPNSPTYAQYIASGTLSQSLHNHDWAFNAVDGQLYTVEKSSNILYRVDPSNGNVTSLGVVPILSGLNYTYGAVYFDADGRFYVSANQTGTIYVIQEVQTLDEETEMESNIFAFGPSSSSNDGARCPTAPVPQEDCINGLDDDGDGLVDCEDPSCSGYANCPVIEAPTTSSNDGGLESNGRLSQQINQRNFYRAKSGYSFDQMNARRVTRASMNAQRNGNNSFMLQDFIPLTTISEDYVVDATPQDLVGITNATEVYAVDYMKNNNSIASILALKTENGVYEHTKYICDRLLGAEILSISTIELTEDFHFIKSLIKNADNTVEFVLSLSARVINSDANFQVDSHWNIDQYDDTATYYNFQIWTKSIDDLYSLGLEVLSLLNAEKPISDYDLSTPPTVFVKKGQYINGTLDLEIVNTNLTSNVDLTSGYRLTETSEFESYDTTVDVSGGYITNHQVDTGSLFDIGFRIGDGIETPDDLFMSDGPWGIDDADPSTSVLSYEILPNNQTFNNEEFPVARNLDLEVETSGYVSAYRALTPRFQPVDVSDYNTFKFTASGSGIMQVTLIKSSISDWEDQYRASVSLSESSSQDFEIHMSSFLNDMGQHVDANDITTIVFTLESEDGTSVKKHLNIEHLRFSQQALSTDELEANVSEIKVYPNPLKQNATIEFNTATSQNIEVMVYNQLGAVVHKLNFESVVGNNKVDFDRQSLASGLYFLRVSSHNNHFKTIKLIIE